LDEPAYTEAPQACERSAPSFAVIFTKLNYKMVTFLETIRQSTYFAGFRV
jgi:hypothetical protein